MATAQSELQQEWERRGHGLLLGGAQAIESSTANSVGLFGGMAGLGFAAHCLSHSGSRYRSLLLGIDAYFAQHLPAICSHLISQAGGLSEADFDLVSGITGIGVYLLSRVRHNRDLVRTLSMLLETLVEILGVDALNLPRWRTPKSLAIDSAMNRYFSEGHLNVGMAHGLPGPIALLALALQEGCTVRGHKACLRTSVDWLMSQQLTDEWGINWPAALPYSAASSPNTSVTIRPTRAAWCYGSLGIARALWIAANTLSDEHVRSTSLETIRAVLRRPDYARNIPSSTFCHGLAGLTYIVRRFAADTQEPELIEASATLVKDLQARFDHSSPFGYRDISHTGDTIDDPGLLEGAGGVLLTLASAVVEEEPLWDRVFLIA